MCGRKRPVCGWIGSLYHEMGPRKGGFSPRGEEIGSQVNARNLRKTANTPAEAGSRTVKCT